MRQISLRLLLVLLIFVCHGCSSMAACEGNCLAKYNELEPSVQGLPPHVLKYALTAYYKARATGYDRKQILTIIDYQLPSTSPRLWVLDLKHDKVDFNMLVSHGRNSGNLYAHAFSNVLDSKESSLGLFLTGSSYYGNLGYSMLLHGLDKNYNGNALRRHIVFHGAPYATEAFADHFGYLGRSWGCPALDPKKVRQVINTIKSGTLVFAYYPNQSWLTHSTYLN